MSTYRPHIAACLFELAAAGQAPARIALIPAGEFAPPEGAAAMEGGTGPWHLSESGARRIVAAWAQRKARMLIDYEHQSLLVHETGHIAPAAGWIDPASLQWDPALGLTAAVEWTERARALIEAGEYRYLSPVFRYDTDTGEVIGLISVGLTNDPAIDGWGDLMRAAARRAPFTAEEAPDMPDALRKALAAALSLDAGADDEALVAAAKAAVTQAVGVEALKAEISEAQQALAAAKAAAPKLDLSQYVPKAVYDEALAAARAAGAANAAAELDGLIEAGLADGRIPGKATADWLRGQGLAYCRAHLGDAPATAALAGKRQTQGKTPPAEGADPELADEERAVLAQMGVDQAAYLATRKQLFPAQEARA